MGDIVAGTARLAEWSKYAEYRAICDEETDGENIKVPDDTPTFKVPHHKHGKQQQAQYTIAYYGGFEAAKKAAAIQGDTLPDALLEAGFNQAAAGALTEPKILGFSKTSAF